MLVQTILAQLGLFHQLARDLLQIHDRIAQLAIPCIDHHTPQQLNRFLPVSIPLLPLLHLLEIPKKIALPKTYQNLQQGNHKRGASYQYQLMENIGVLVSRLKWPTLVELGGKKFAYFLELA